MSTNVTFSSEHFPLQKFIFHISSSMNSTPQVAFKLEKIKERQPELAHLLLLAAHQKTHLKEQKGKMWTLDSFSLTATPANSAYGFKPLRYSPRPNDCRCSHVGPLFVSLFVLLCLWFR